jgi:hypothetical protein
MKAVHAPMNMSLTVIDTARGSPTPPYSAGAAGAIQPPSENLRHASA